MKDLEWNVDGHRIVLTVNKTTIDVSPSICPHGAVQDSPCYHSGIESCLVNHFINVYGLESNHGVVPASDSIEIAWAMSGSSWDIDLVEFNMIPRYDPHFSDWYDAVTSE
jgi:hypothetical protein